MPSPASHPLAAGSGPVVVIGETVLDLVPTRGGGTAERVGGSPANVARGLARLGRPVSLMSALGDDPVGKVLATALGDSGVEVVSAAKPGARSATARAHLDAEGRATYDLDIPWDPLPLHLPTATAWLHTGSLALVLDPGRATVLAALDEAAAQPGVTVSIDLNLRDPLPWDLDTCRRWFDRVAALADVVKASDEDLGLLYPGQPDASVAERWLGRGATSLVVVTRGAAGALAITTDGMESVTSPQVNVVDTVGAGDTFMASLIDGLLPQEGEGASDGGATGDGATGEGLRGVLSRAAAAAAFCCQREGAVPPSRDELDAFLAASGTARDPH